MILKPEHDLLADLNNSSFCFVLFFQSRTGEDLKDFMEALILLFKGMICRSQGRINLMCNCHKFLEELIERC